MRPRACERLRACSTAPGSGRSPRRSDVRGDEPRAPMRRGIVGALICGGAKAGGVPAVCSRSCLCDTACDCSPGCVRPWASAARTASLMAFMASSSAAADEGRSFDTSACGTEVPACGDGRGLAGDPPMVLLTAAAEALCRSLGTSICREPLGLAARLAAAEADLVSGDDHRSVALATLRECDGASGTNAGASSVPVAPSSVSSAQLPTSAASVLPGFGPG